MSGRCNLFNWLFVLQWLLLCSNCRISALSCYDCKSTFPGSNICLPSCGATNRNNSTCFLTRDIPLEPNYPGSVSAGHIDTNSTLFDAQEKYFVYGQEAAYLSPSDQVGWNWMYGPITYGCDTNGCNNPRNVNSLPNALNARIPNGTLNQWLTGDLDNSCYQCSKCLDQEITDVDMSDCAKTPCPNHACNLVATRAVPSCNGGWRFTSSCILSREPAQVEMTIMQYIRSKTTVLYQMEATCLSDNCNNVTTFKQLKNAISVDPDFNCLLNSTTSSTSQTARPGTSPATTTPKKSSALQMTSTMNVFYLMSFLFLIIRF